MTKNQALALKPGDKVRISGSGHVGSFYFGQVGVVVNPGFGHYRHGLVFTSHGGWFPKSLELIERAINTPP